MALIEVGRVCIKKFGRDAGAKAIVTKIVDKSHVHIVTSIRPRDRKCNVNHLEFLSEKIDPKNEDALYRALEIERPTAAKQTKAKK